MPRYHVSEDGTPRVCIARSAESCTALGVDGESAPHGDFNDVREARRFAESIMENSFGEQKPLTKDSAAGGSLPSLSSVYGEAPRVNIGVAQTYGNLNGIQRDLDEGYIDEQEARSRIASIAEDLKRLEGHSSAAQRPNAIAFRERLESLADGAEPAKALVDNPRWNAVAESLNDYLYSRTPRTKDDRPYEVLRDRIGEVKSGYEGFSISKVVELSKEMEKNTAQARKPELVALRERLGEAISNPTGSAVSASNSTPVVPDQELFSADEEDISEYRVENGNVKAYFEGQDIDFGTLQEVPKEEFDRWNDEVFGGTAEFDEGSVLPVHIGSTGEMDGVFARFGDKYYRTGSHDNYYQP